MKECLWKQSGSAEDAMRKSKRVSWPDFSIYDVDCMVTCGCLGIHSKKSDGLVTFRSFTRLNQANKNDHVEGKFLEDYQNVIPPKSH